MASNTSIEWCDSTWNPIRGCTRKSPGCVNCYAEVMAARFSDPGQWGHGFAAMKGGDHRWTGKVELVESQLLLPMTWRKPRRIFVNSTSDLFHEALSDETIDKVFAVMAFAGQHTYQILTKRPERMPQYFARRDRARKTNDAARSFGVALEFEDISLLLEILPNVWLGASVEDNERARERIPLLRTTPAAVRFLSLEPLLEELKPFEMTGIHQVIIGGESGPHARMFDTRWATPIIEQCAREGVACFVKQLGSNVTGPHANGVNVTTLKLADSKGGDMAEWPKELRVRQFPISKG
jgi:protein gp37